MECPDCRYANPDGMKFCGRCGAKLENICPTCRFSNPDSFKFCGECGADLNLPPEIMSSGLSFEEKLEKIKRYLPENLIDKILSQKDRIEGEHRQVTVMFCDLAGFTELSERLGPEESYLIMDQVYEILIQRVHDYEGTVNEMTGDGIMALFGAPIALEDAPQRAIRSADAIHRELAIFSNGIKSQKQDPTSLKMRIGIHTGPVVVGSLGNDLRVEFKVVGDTVNLASRMEGFAEPGSTYVTEDTFKLTEGLFRFEALGKYTIKGQSGAVKAYRVIAPSNRRTRFDVSAERGLTPFVGREKELELVLDSFERSRSGRGQAISIVSEAGGGKSRLLYEFRKAIANENITILEGKCLSYSRAVAYHPLIDILKSIFNLTIGESDTEIRSKVGKGLKFYGIDEADALPYLLELLSVTDSGIEKIFLSPEGKKERIVEVFKEIILKGSDIRPLVLAIEDLHWIDKSSEEILKYMIERMPQGKFLLVLTYRPEFVPNWSIKPYHHKVSLNRLSNRNILLMTAFLLETEKFDQTLSELVVEKSEGVPLYTEEFIKSLKELKFIELRNSTYHLAANIHEVTVPSTIQEVIMARVDSLPQLAKEVLQTGSVIEREFGFELIRKVTGFAEQVLAENLTILKESELLYQRGVHPRTVYVFKHAVTREVVYDSILQKNKKRLHKVIGLAIEELHRANINQYLGVLVKHFFESKEYEKVAKYSKAVSKKAEKTASLNDAIAYTKKRLAALENLEATDEVKNNIISARTTLGLYAIQIGYIEDAKDTILPVKDLAIEHGNKRRQSQINIILGSHSYMIEENYPEAFKYLNKGLLLAEETNDIISTVLVNYYLGVAFTLNCEFDPAYRHIEKALEINEMVNNLWGMSVMRSHLSLTSNYQGNIEAGFQHSRKAVQLADESGDVFSKAMAYTMHGYSCYHRGEFSKAVGYLTLGADFGERIDYFAWNSVSQFYLGESHFEMKAYQKAMAYYEKAVWFLENNRWLPSFMNLHKISLLRANVMADKTNINLMTMREYEGCNKIKRFEGQMQRYIGEILLNLDEIHQKESEEWIKKAIDSDQRNGVMMELGRDYALYAKLLIKRGERSRAAEKLEAAIEIFERSRAGSWALRCSKELTPLIT